MFVQPSLPLPNEEHIIASNQTSWGIALFQSVLHHQMSEVNDEHAIICSYCLHFAGGFPGVWLLGYCWVDNGSPCFLGTGFQPFSPKLGPRWDHREATNHGGKNFCSGTARNNFKHDILCISSLRRTSPKVKRRKKKRKRIWANSHRKTRTSMINGTKSCSDSSSRLWACSFFWPFGLSQVRASEHPTSS